MGDRSGIEWTDATWNPVSGCSKVSQGCKHCYAEREWPRLSGRGQPYEGRDFTDVVVHPDRLDQPLRWKRPRRIFVNSMSDLFHEEVPMRFVGDVFDRIYRCPQHTFQILTKRPKRAKAILSNMCIPGKPWPLQNVWLGVSVEDQATADERTPLLLETPAAVRFVSAEPLLGAVDFYATSDSMPLKDHPWRNTPILHGIHWLIAGGESGPKARPSHPDWFRSLRDQCQVADVPFFFKQWGEWVWELREGGWFPSRIGKKAAGRALDGQTWDQYPE